uniref:Zinc inducible protein n=1 Tax=Oryza sativa TaxID=4530 RepID=O22538_ORYSA|nr:zinc inducible protein [Oryza sativa Indica Group]
MALALSTSAAAAAAAAARALAARVTTTRGYPASAASSAMRRAAAAVEGKGAAGITQAKDGWSSSAAREVSWVPDPVRGHYRPSNFAGGADAPTSAPPTSPAATPARDARDLAVVRRTTTPSIHIYLLRVNYSSPLDRAAPHAAPPPRAPERRRRRIIAGRRIGRRRRRHPYRFLAACGLDALLVCWFFVHLSCNSEQGLILLLLFLFFNFHGFTTHPSVMV